MRRVFLLALVFGLTLTLLPTQPGGAVARAASPGAGIQDAYDVGAHQVGTKTVSTSSLRATESGSSGGYFTGFTFGGKNAGEFKVANISCPTGPPGLAANASCSFSVSFTPVARGVRAATLTIGCVNFSNCPYTIDFTGTGTGPCGLAFSDVKESNGACEAIEGLAARGIIKGCDQAVTPPRFCPGDPTVRAQMAALIARTVGWDAEDHQNAFPDRCLPSGGCIDDALWRNVGTLQFYGVAKGFQDGTYNPFDNVLHAQTISFITRAMVKKGTWTQATVDDGTVYPNIPASSGHRLDFVTYVARVGPVPGTTTKTQNFDAWNTPSTREWFALALWQAIK